jgi:asparagine synthase (glutamine-hydrolysing)
MCGIAGILNFHSNKDNIPVMKNMLSSIAHRGPDESGIYSGNCITLGHVRLSIIDLSTGQQPLSDNSDNFWITFNGEIFNYIELRQDLILKGYTFRTQSDTEVLVNCYRAYGEKCLEKLNGQFAFAIWDKTKQELFLARDRVGIAPLYYTQVNNTLIFASEIKGILHYPEVIPQIDNQSLKQIFTFWSAITPRTIFKNIFEVTPGCFLKVTKQGIFHSRYWSFSFPCAEEEQKQGSFEESLSEFGSLFYDANKIRLRADVPVAAYLSGGLDSSATTAYIKNIEPDVLQTFSVGFTDASFDETSYQQEASHYFNTRHNSFTCSANDIVENFPEVIYHTEIPLLRTSPVPMFLLSRFVRRNNIKVVITGEGSDEIFAGYDTFKEDVIRRFWAMQPNSKIRPLLLKKLYPYMPHLQNSSVGMLRMFFGYKLTETQNPLYSHLLRWNNTSHAAKHFSAEVFSDIDGYDPMFEVTKMLPSGFDKWKPLSKAQWLEMTIFTSGYLLTSQGDRMLLANAVEGRFPFFDHRVMEYAAKLPTNLKMHGLNEKYFLKQLMQNRIPESIVKRPKQPYRAPISNTFLAPGAPSYVKELLGSQKLKEYGIFNPDTVQLLLKKMMAQTPSEVDNMALTGILSTQLIHQFFIQGAYKEKCDKNMNPNIIIDKN